MITCSISQEPIVTWLKYACMSGSTTKWVEKSDRKTVVNHILFVEVLQHILQDCYHSISNWNHLRKMDTFSREATLSTLCISTL